MRNLWRMPSDSSREGRREREMRNLWRMPSDSSSSSSSSSGPSSPATDHNHSSSAFERHLATMETETGHSGSTELVSVMPMDENREPIVALPYQCYPIVAQQDFFMKPGYSRNDNCSIM